VRTAPTSLEQRDCITATEKLQRHGKTLALIGSIFALLVAAGPAQAQGMPGAFQGSVYATYANVKAGPIAASLGRSAFLSCACEGTNGQTLTSEIDNLAAGNVLTAGVTTGSIFTQRTDTTATVQNSAGVTGLNIMGGMITADALTVTATVTATANSVTPTSSATLANLVVAGQQIPVNVPANTVIPLPGIGSVTLNKVTLQGMFRHSGTVSVDFLAIDVKVKNNFGLKVGAQIIVGHAAAGFDRNAPADVFDGQAYAAEGNAALGDVLNNKIGKAAAVGIPCQGTHRKTRQNSIAGQNIAGVLVMGDGLTTAFGGNENGADVARTTAQIASINLLGGIVSVDAIQAVAQSSVTNGVTTISTDGSGFTGLTVAGVTIPLNTPPNTTLPLLGLGTVTINEQIVKPTSVVVNGLHLKVSTVNLLGLPVGSEIILAHADSAAQPY
jgi:hypothetical protein